MVPARDPANLELARWVVWQREKYAYMKLPADKQAAHKQPELSTSELSAEQVDLLEQLGFVWDLFESDWMVRYNELKLYVAANGRADVPARYPANPQLADWVINQRRVHKTGKLSPEHYALLEAVGFVHDPRNASFDASFKKLQVYAAAHHGSTEVPANYKEDPPCIGRVGQRQAGGVREEQADAALCGAIRGAELRVERLGRCVCARL
jgi:hypothetical protein